MPSLASKWCGLSAIGWPALPLLATVAYLIRLVLV